MLTSSLIRPPKAFFILMGDDGIDAVPEPRSRPSSGCSPGCRITKQVRVENSAIDIDPSSNRDAAAHAIVGDKGSADTTAEGDVADKVLWNTDVAHALLNDPLKGIRVAGGKIRGMDRWVRLHGEYASTGIRARVRHQYPPCPTA